jgi:hypothetical protein
VSQDTGDKLNWQLAAGALRFRDGRFGFLTELEYEPNFRESVTEFRELAKAAPGAALPFCKERKA